MKSVEIHPEAEAEVKQAYAYYEGQRPGLGDDFLAELEAALIRIRRMPKMFGLTNYPDIRKCLVKRFPYSIFFSDEDQVVWIAAVAHQRRRPGYWLGRTL